MRTQYDNYVAEIKRQLEEAKRQADRIKKLEEMCNITFSEFEVMYTKAHKCRYSKAMGQPSPRLCVDCGKPEGNQ